MFGLFKKKNHSPALTHFVYLNQISKYRMLVERAQQSVDNGHDLILIYHFDETGNMLHELTKAISLSNDKLSIVKSDQIKNILSEKSFKSLEVIVAEVYPMAGKDQVLHETIRSFNPAATITFYTSTDGPLMKAFGGEKIHNMMITLGLSENEKIEHAMVSKSILRAQEKISGKVTFEKAAYSKQEWMNINLPTNL